MSAPAASMVNIVRVFTQEELEARKAAVVEELERRFGSLDRALEREEDWDYDDDEARLFSKYHDLFSARSDSFFRVRFFLVWSHDLEASRSVELLFVGGNCGSGGYGCF